jgi:hypothetical protein
VAALLCWLLRLRSRIEKDQLLNVDRYQIKHECMAMDSSGDRGAPAEDLQWGCGRSQQANRQGQLHSDS